MTDDKDFINWTYDPMINRDRADIVLDMVRFIREGLRDLSGPTKLSPEFHSFENSIKAALFERLQSPMAKAIPKRMLQPAGDTVDLVAACFQKEHEWLMKGGAIGAFTCASITDSLQQRLNSFWHPEVDEEKPSLATAFEVTFSNVARAGTRLTLMHTIPSLLKLRETPDGWAKIREDLWIRKMGFQRDLLLFGALGGEHLLKAAVKQVAPQVCYQGDSFVRYSLIHFLQRDGYTPGRWMVDTEESLEADIKRAYEAL